MKKYNENQSDEIILFDKMQQIKVKIFQGFAAVTNRNTVRKNTNIAIGSQNEV